MVVYMQSDGVSCGIISSAARGKKEMVVQWRKNEQQIRCEMLDARCHFVTFRRQQSGFQMTAFRCFTSQKARETGYTSRRSS